MSLQDDLEVIRAEAHARFIHDLANDIRAQHGQLVPVEQSIPILSAPIQAVEPRRTVTVTPVTIEPEGEQLGWWMRHWPKVAIGAASTAFLGLLTWGIVRIVTAAATATAHALPAVLPIAVVILLALLFCGRGGGGGKTISGTFQGRIH